jgi:hypothetical protein
MALKFVPFFLAFELFIKLFAIKLVLGIYIEFRLVPLGGDNRLNSGRDRV